MRSVKMLGLVVGAVLVVSSVASASAFAYPGYEGFGKSEESFTANSSTVATLEVDNGDRVTCKVTLVKGTILNGTATAAKVSVLYHGCEEPTNKISCTTSGLTTGLVETKALRGLLVTLTSNGKTGFLLSPESGTTILEVSCTSLVNLIITGSTLGEYTGSVGKTLTEFPFKFSQSGGKPALTGYEDGNGSGTAVLKTTATGFIKFENLESGFQDEVLARTTNGGEVLWHYLEIKTPAPPYEIKEKSAGIEFFIEYHGSGSSEALSNSVENAGEFVIEAAKSNCEGKSIASGTTCHIVVTCPKAGAKGKLTVSSPKSWLVSSVEATLVCIS